MSKKLRILAEEFSDIDYDCDDNTGEMLQNLLLKIVRAIGRLEDRLDEVEDDD